MKRRFKVMTTDSNHSLPIAPNILNRDFYASKVDEKYVGDITYIPTSEGWLYLAVGTQRIWPARAFTLGHLTHNDLAS
jgi:transposase InsO family protein